MKVQGSGFPSIEQLQDQYLRQQNKTEVPAANGGASFREILEGRQASVSGGVSELKFSKHASGRLAQRSIELTRDQMQRLQDGASKAEAKGIKESLVIVDDYAFIVNIPNSTVVTAMDSTETQDNVFTNIDGAVIM